MAMTVHDLITLLRGYPPETPVALAKDADGTEVRLLAQRDPLTYGGHRPADGDPARRAGGGACRCVVLWPAR